MCDRRNRLPRRAYRASALQTWRGGLHHLSQRAASPRPPCAEPAPDGDRRARFRLVASRCSGLRRLVFHAAGYVGANPTEAVWRVNAHGPLAAVDAAAREGVPRVVLTSTVSAIGPAEGADPADEERTYPEGWLGLTYSDSKRQGEQVALEVGEHHGVEVVIVNPSYLLGVPVDPETSSETSTRIVGNYLRGRLPAIIDAPINVADVVDAADGHLLAAERGHPGERYILGGENTSWPQLIDLIAEVSGVHRPIAVLPRAIARMARLRDDLNLPGELTAEGYELMAQDWRFSSEKARRELGYAARPLNETIEATIAWYRKLIGGGALDGGRTTGLSTLAEVMRGAHRLGLLAPVRIGQRLAGRRLLAGV